jgi:hypothetical protein
MFHFISWSSFIQYTTVVLAIYWFTVYLIYYKTEIVSLIKNGRQKSTIYNSQTSESNNDHLFDECNACATQLKSIIRQNSLDNIDKGTILSEAKELLKQHPLMFQAKWQIPINNLIEYECRQHYDLIIEEKDLMSLWNK